MKGLDILLLILVLLLVSVKVGELTEEVDRLKTEIKCKENATTAGSLLVNTQQQ
tara:strand:- start:341 stop:502 length:162 start_codon:yes stop_codon:yes gene_type:complete